jgi:hypothetical protein
MLDSARSSGAGLGCAGSGVAGSIGRCEVGRVARGQTGGVGRTGARVGSVGRLGAHCSVGLLGPGDWSLIHHAR